MMRCERMGSWFDDCLEESHKKSIWKVGREEAAEVMLYSMMHQFWTEETKHDVFDGFAAKARARFNKMQQAREQRWAAEEAARNKRYQQ